MKIIIILYAIHFKQGIREVSLYDLMLDSDISIIIFWKEKATKDCFVWQQVSWTCSDMAVYRPKDFQSSRLRINWQQLINSVEDCSSNNISARFCKILQNFAPRLTFSNFNMRFIYLIINANYWCCRTLAFYNQSFKSYKKEYG